MLRQQKGVHATNPTVCSKKQAKNITYTNITTYPM